jgi:methyl-accepting chemotaxis protein
VRKPAVRLSVRTKISFFIGLAVMLIVAFMMLYFPRRMKRQAEEALGHKAASLARMVAYNVAAGLEFDDSVAANRVLAGAASDRDFLYAGVYTAEGKLFASRGLPEGKRVLQRKVDRLMTHDEQRGRFDVLLPIRSRGGSAGTLRLGVSREAVNKEIAANLTATLLIGTVVLVCGFIVAWLFGRSLGSRLKIIEAVAQEVAAGNLSLDRVSDPGSDEIGALARSFDRMVAGFRHLEQHVNRVANGDLSTAIDMEGDLAGAFNQMIANQRVLVERISRTSAQVSSVAAEFLATAQQQQRGSVEQSSAVEQNRRTMETLAKSELQTAETTRGVLRNAEQTQGNTQVVAQRITALTLHTQRIGEILEVIREIANKSDLLALNAALEGTKAGEAGRGFSLVANQMQRLAENVMGSVRDIKDLMSTIGEATQATVVATEETQKLAADTTRSARQIALSIQQQQAGTEQVLSALDGVSHIAGESATASEQIVRSAQELTDASEKLTELVGRFVIGSSEALQGNSPAEPAALSPTS